MYVYSCMYVCMYGCMYVRMYFDMYVCMYACMYVCMYVRIYICLFTYVLYTDKVHKLSHLYQRGNLSVDEYYDAKLRLECGETRQKTPESSINFSGFWSTLTSDLSYAFSDPEVIRRKKAAVEAGAAAAHESIVHGPTALAHSGRLASAAAGLTPEFNASHSLEPPSLTNLARTAILPEQQPRPQIESREGQKERDGEESLGRRGESNALSLQIGRGGSRKGSSSDILGKINRHSAVSDRPRTESITSESRLTDAIIVIASGTNESNKTSEESEYRQPENSDHGCRQDRCKSPILQEQIEPSLEPSLLKVPSNHAKLIDNFSHESDVTSLKTPF